MQRAVCNYLDCSYNIATSIHRVAKCIGYHGSRELLRKDGHYAICYLLSLILQTPKVICLLQDMAELLSTDEKQMLIENFPVCKILRKYLNLFNNFSDKKTYVYYCIVFSISAVIHF